MTSSKTQSISHGVVGRIRKKKKIFALSSPINPPIQIFHQGRYTTREEVTLKVKSGLFRGACYTVKDDTGKPWFTFVPSSRKDVCGTLHNASGADIYTLANEDRNGYSKHKLVLQPGGLGKGHHIFKLTRQATTPKLKIDTIIRNKTADQDVRVVLKAKWLENRSAKIFVKTNVGLRIPLATVVAGKDTSEGSDAVYDVHIAAGVDAAMILALFITFDEGLNE